MCASHKLEMRKEAAQEMRSVMRKKLLITAAAIILSADFIAGGTMAIYRAAAHTDKTISTSSIGVSLNVNEDNIDRNSNENEINTEMVNQRVIQKVSAKNTGARPQYVRVKVKKEWLDNKEAVTEREGQKLNKDYIGINYVNTNDWIYVSPSGNDDDPDGYLYYKKIVAPGESTSDFMDAYTVLLGVNGNTNIYRDLSARVTYDANAIQTVAAKAAMLYEWGILAEIDDDGMIQDIKYPESGKEYEITDDITKVTPGAKALAADASVKTSEKNATSITLDNSAVKFGVVEKNADFKDMEPGESREGKISLYNNSDKNMDFYINSELISNIADEGSKAGIYNIKIYKSVKDNEYSLLYDGVIGSQDTTGNTKTDSALSGNILIGDKYIATLSGGESADIRIVVTLDGETMDNSYMNKEGRIRINVSAQPNSDAAVTKTSVMTGDNSLLMLYGVLAVIAGTAVLGTLAGLYCRRKEKHNTTKKEL